MMANARKRYQIKWTVSMQERALLLLRRQSEKSGVSMSKLLNLLILRAEKEGWA